MAVIAAQLALRAQADASTPVVPGEVAANAALLGVVPQASSLSLTTSAGQSEAAYNETEDQASSGTIDMGGLGVLLANSPVCGSVFFTPQRQPQVLSADSQDGSRTVTNTSSGSETVTVSSNPEYADATTAPVTQTIAGVLQIHGQTETTVRYITNQEQEATATVVADISLVNGLVDMEGARWYAEMQTGTKNVSQTSFDPGTVTVAPAGIPVALPSSDSAAQVFSAINSVLSTVGLSISQPAQSSDANTGTLSITPLDLHFSGSATDNKVVGPAAQQAATIEDAIAGQTADGSDCTNTKNLLGNLLTPSEVVGNLGLAAAQGAGGVDIDLGGATVSTQAAPDYSNPFGSGGNPFTSGSLPPVTQPPSSVTIPISTPAASTVTPSSPATVITPTAGRTAAGAPAKRVAPTSGPTLIRCVTTSPAHRPSCWNGLGAVAGAVAVVVGVVLFGADLAPGLIPALIPGGGARRRSTKRRSSRRQRSPRP